MNFVMKLDNQVVKVFKALHIDVAEGKSRNINPVDYLGLLLFVVVVSSIIMFV
jgi:hypothetical protein